MTETTTPQDGDAAQVRSVVSALASDAVGEFGLELVDVVVKGPRGRRIVRVVVDADEGLDVDDIAALSRGLSERLDQDDDLIEGAYTLEVTSPGAERPLTEPRHWQRNVGRNVFIEHVVAKGDEQKMTETTGKLAEADDEQVVVNVKGRMVKIRLDDVERARVVLPW